MANTYSQIYIHIVFAVSGRQSLIRPENKEDLQQYIGGVIRNCNHKLIAIHCMPDHVHILVGLRPSFAISQLVNAIKTGSAKYINSKQWVRGRFSWQEGFGAFSCSHSSLGSVARYIENQTKHHQKHGFRAEYLFLLDAYNVDFEERYTFQYFDEGAIPATTTEESTR